MCKEMVVTSGDGATGYMLSYGNQNSPYQGVSSFPDTEGNPQYDGDVSGSDFEPQSISASVGF